MRRFLAARLPEAGETIVLSQMVSHHLLRVTGIAPGEHVELFDGHGSVCIAALDRVESGLAVVVGVGPALGREVEATVWLLASQLRPAAFDNLLRMTTELGVARIVPVHTERVVARGDRSERWRRIAVQAAAQCGRTRVPDVSPPLPFADALATVPQDMARRICVPGAEPMTASGAPVALLLGPEGGFTVAEVGIAVEHRFAPAGLGATVLRADTAGVVAVSRVLGPSVSPTAHPGQ